MATPRGPALRPKPPDKGSFPLDHEGECKEAMMKYMKCLESTGRDSNSCRQESKDYLQCRMEKELMVTEDFRRLGYHDNQHPQSQEN